MAQLSLICLTLAGARSRIAHGEQLAVANEQPTQQESHRLRVDGLGRSFILNSIGLTHRAHHEPDNKLETEARRLPNLLGEDCA